MGATATDIMDSMGTYGGAPKAASTGSGEANGFNPTGGAPGYAGANGGSASGDIGGSVANMGGSEPSKNTLW